MGRNLPFAAAVATLLFSGCFAHKEAPERETTARGLDEAIADAGAVERVELNNSKLGAVPDALASMPRLRTLYLADGAFTNFAALASLKTVETLDLSRCRLADAPAEIAGMDALRDLYLGGCSLAAFPEAVSGLAHLRYLNLDRNKIGELPGNLPPALRWLRLNYNSIQALPASIGSLGRLQRLYLRANAVEALPDSLANCTELEDLDLAGNDLAAFPEVLVELPRLRNLDLSGNRRITALPDTEKLSKMKALRSLKLTGCPLEEKERDRIRACLHHNCAIIF